LSFFGLREKSVEISLYGALTEMLSTSGKARAETTPAERAKNAKMDPKFFMMMS